MRYFVHSTDGVNYRIGVWKDGEWVWGSREDALREWYGLCETGSYVFGVQP